MGLPSSQMRRLKTLELDREKLEAALEGDLNNILRMNVIGTALKKQSAFFRRLNPLHQQAVIDGMDDLHMNPGNSLSKVLRLHSGNKKDPGPHTQLWFFVVVMGTILHPLPAKINEEGEEEEQWATLKPGSIFGDDYERHSPLKFDFNAGAQGCRLAACTNVGLVASMKRCEFARGGIELMIDQELRAGILIDHWIFRHFTPHQISCLSGAMKAHKYQKNKVIFEQGDPGTGFYVIALGEAEVLIEKPNQKVKPGQQPVKDVVATLHKGQYVGERALLFGEPRAATVMISSKDADLWYVEEKLFKSLVNRRLLEYLVIEIENKKQVELADLERVNMLGRGALGPVKMVVHRETGKRYALKCQHRQTLIETDKMECFSRESEFLQTVDHPFIIRLVNHFEEHDWMYLLTEFVTGGMLIGALNQLDPGKRGIPPRQAKFYLGTLLLALQYLHSHSVVYRNLKPEIVMLDYTGYPKIIDFLNAKRISGRTYTSIGTPQYMAPEIIRGKGYGTAADIWSLGVLCYRLVYGTLPFGDGEENPMEICKSVINHAEDVRNDLTNKTRNSNVENRMSAQMARMLLEPDPLKRVPPKTGYQQIREHIFFIPVDGKDIEDQVETYFDKLISRSIDPPFVPTSEYVGTPLSEADKEEFAEGERMQRASLLM